jgi:hypothetical protein
MHTALGIALCTRCGANGVGCLLHQQGLIAMQGVQTAQTFLQMRVKLRQGQLHKSMAHQNGVCRMSLLAIKAF